MSDTMTDAVPATLTREEARARLRALDYGRHLDHPVESLAAIEERLPLVSPKRRARLHQLAAVLRAFIAGQAAATSQPAAQPRPNCDPASQIGCDDGPEDRAQPARGASLETRATDPRAAAEEALRLHEAATPGEWVHSPPGVDEPHVSTRHNDGPVSWIASPRSVPSRRWHDAAFIARARTLLPILARAVIEQASAITSLGLDLIAARAELAKVRGAADAWKALAKAHAKTIDGTGSIVTTARAVAALRALGIEPEGE